MNRTRIASLLAALVLVTGAAAPLATLAAETTGVSNGASTGLQNPLKVNSLAELLNLLLDFIITIGGIVVVVMLVVVGFRFVAAQGNSEKLTEAKTMLLWTVIGALVLLGAKAIQAGIAATVSSLSA